MTLDTEAIKQIGNCCKEIVTCAYEAVTEELKKPEYEDIRPAINLNSYTLILYGRDDNEQEYLVDKFSDIKSKIVKGNPDRVRTAIKIWMIFDTNSQQLMSAASLGSSNKRTAARNNLSTAVLRSLFGKYELYYVNTEFWHREPGEQTGNFAVGIAYTAYTAAES